MYKILLVEDDINIVNHLSSFLEKEGFLITYVDGQKKAIELIKNQHFDLALLDISLKEGNGYSLYNEIKSYKDIPIVFLTANQDEFSVVTGLNLGADDYISKPFRPRELVSRIQNILRRYHKQETFYQYQNIKFLKADAFRMKFPDNTFDYIINEAMLTMFSNKSKERALKEYLRVLKPGGLLFTHDIALVNNYEETRKQLSEAINISVFPLPQNEWKELFSQIGFTTVNFLQDELTLMDPKGMITDEGLTNTLRILKNGLKSENRAQFIKMKTTFSKLEKDLNFICFVNKKAL